MNVVRWGLIGCGDIARKAVGPAMARLEMCQLVMACSRDPGRAEWFSREFGTGRWCTCWEDLVCDDGVDAVYVATPHDLHACQTIASAEAGKHVLCEKPMSLSVSDCRRMIEFCARHRVKLGVAYYRRFYPIIERTREILESGVLGVVSLCQIDSFHWYDLLRPADPQYWLFQKGRSGGGALMIGGCHRIEILLNLFGPIAETVSLKDRIHPAREVEDTGVAVFRFESGPLGVLCMSHSIQEPRDTIMILGSEGSVHIPDLNRGELVLAKAGKVIREQHPRHPNTHFPLIRSFCDSVLEDRKPVVDGEMGLAVQEIEESIYSEHSSGREGSGSAVPGGSN